MIRPLKSLAGAAGTTWIAVDHAESPAGRELPFEPHRRLAGAPHRAGTAVDREDQWRGLPRFDPERGKLPVLDTTSVRPLHPALRRTNHVAVGKPGVRIEDRSLGAVDQHTQHRGIRRRGFRPCDHVPAHREAPDLGGETISNSDHLDRFDGRGTGGVQRNGPRTRRGEEDLRGFVGPLEFVDVEFRPVGRPDRFTTGDRNEADAGSAVERLVHGPSLEGEQTSVRTGHRVGERPPGRFQDHRRRGILREIHSLESGIEDFIGMNLSTARGHDDAPPIDRKHRVEPVDDTTTEAARRTRVVTNRYEEHLSQADPLLDRLLALEGDSIDEPWIAVGGVPFEPGPDLRERAAGIGSDAIRLRSSPLGFIVPAPSRPRRGPGRGTILTNDLRKRSPGLHHESTPVRRPARSIGSVLEPRHLPRLTTVEWQDPDLRPGILVVIGVGLARANERQSRPIRREHGARVASVTEGQLPRRRVDVLEVDAVKVPANHAITRTDGTIHVAGPFEHLH